MKNSYCHFVERFQIIYPNTKATFFRHKQPCSLAVEYETCIIKVAMYEKLWVKLCLSAFINVLCFHISFYFFKLSNSKASQLFHILRFHFTLIWHFKVNKRKWERERTNSNKKEKKEGIMKIRDTNNRKILMKVLEKRREKEFCGKKTKDAWNRSERAKRFCDYFFITERE